jgi:serine/threonine protein kinase
MQVPQTEILVRGDDGSALLRVVLTPGEYVIGREEGCELHVEAERVAGRHARLTVNYDHLLIEDLGSSDGTLVNGQAIADATRLWPNQKVQLGAATLEFRRLKATASPDVSLAPSTAALRAVLPEELLREKRYAIGGVVAQGGMGAILDAKEAAIERTVAMKVMLDGSSPDDLVRFVAEAKVTGQLEHPNIVPVHELGVDENEQVFYTMKFVRGITLRKVLDLMAGGAEATLRKYPLGSLLTIFQKVCDAVAFAHSKGVIHRDLKPENIMLGDFGEVLVMDWGLAKILNDECRMTNDEAAAPSSFVLRHSSFTPTMTGSIMGTPQYMAPEQARGEVETLDERADIYALGAILFHILALRPSVEGDDAMAVVEKVARGEVLECGDLSPLSMGGGAGGGGRAPRGGKAAMNRAHSTSLLAVVRKAMAFDKAQRYASVAEVQADLTAYQNGFATSAEHASWPRRAALAIKRNKTVSLATALVLATGLGFGTKALMEGRRAERALAELRETAPTFHAQAKALLDEGKFDAAIAKIGYAIKLDEDHADYHLFRANLRQATQDLTRAADGYRRVLALRPDDTAAKTNLAICERLLAESNGAALNREQQLQLLAALRAQKRLVEAAPLSAAVEPDLAIAEAALRARLREYKKQPGWKDDRVARLPDGTFKVDLMPLALGDLSVLDGQPVSILNLRSTGLVDLKPLAGLPLKELDLTGAKATDLSPLRGMPLEVLHLAGMPLQGVSQLKGMKLRTLTLSDMLISDLTPLAGMALEVVKLDNTRVVELAPLRGMPLTYLMLINCNALSDLSPLATCSKLQRLFLVNTAVSDLTPLARLRLTEIRFGGSRVTNLAPLRGQPLQRFDYGGRTKGIDVSPLAECVDLEDIVLPEDPRNVALLRSLPRLKRISIRATGGIPLQTAAEFWAEYDAQQKGTAK